MSEHKPSIPEFYRGRKVLITGGSGFMGKVLIEKLLRSCPELHTVYLLLRTKRNVQPSMRIKQLTDIALFDRLKEENPSALDKLVAVCGDVKELGLGLSEEDRRMLQDQVSVIFHSAASVRFDDPITDAVLVNVRGTREVVNLALGMKDLKVMLHISTTYCNFDKPEVLEQLYKSPGDWRAMIDLVERKSDNHLMQCLTHKILGKSPNTYTYCKALAEHVINDHRDQLPLVIVRPSIVTSSVEEPMPGWVDNFNGPVGLYLAGGKGVMRSMYADVNFKGDHVPVDAAIKSIIFIAWHRALYSDVTALPVFNCCNLIRSTSIRETTDLCTLRGQEYPFQSYLWYPSPHITSNRLVHFVSVLLLHMLPAILIDSLLKLGGMKAMLVNLQRKIYIANMNLAIFMFTKITFRNGNFLRLQDRMQEADLKHFAYNKYITDVDEYSKNVVLGARVYLLKEPLSSLPKSRILFNRLYWLHQTTRLMFFLLVVWSIDVYSKMASGWLYIQSCWD